MTENPDRQTERELVLSHIHRTDYRKRFRDGLEEPSSDEYAALDPAERLKLCEARVGIFRPGPESTGAIPSVSRKPYAEEHNPIDKQDW